MLTDAKIRAMTAGPGERVEAADALVAGLRLRVTRNAKTWVLRQRMSGKVRTVTIGHYGPPPHGLGLAAARAKAVELQGRIDEGMIPTPAAPRPRAPADGMTVSGFFPIFLQSRLDRGMKHPNAYRWQFEKYVEPRIGAWALPAVKKADIRQMLLDIREEHGATTARRVGGLLKRLLAYAAQEDAIEVDPAASLVLPGREVSRDRTLTDSELAALWAVTDPAARSDERDRSGRIRSHPSAFPWGPYFRLLVLTGQRRGEVAAMRWDSLDLTAGTWTLARDETKSARAHVVPLSSAAVALLESLPRLEGTDDEGRPAPSPWVLTTNGRVPIAAYSKPKGWLDREMLEQLRAAHGAAALPHWRVHDLRRTVSTNLARIGVDPFIRRRVLNHALEGVDAIYDRFDYLEPKAEALEAWAAALALIVKGEPLPPRFLDGWRRAEAVRAADNVATLEAARARA